MSVAASKKVPGLTVRFAKEDDAELILNFVKELAAFEKLSHEVKATAEQFRQSLFCDRPYAEVVIAEYADKPVGFALFFHNFSTFLGQPGLYLEDLFVSPDMRGKGIGKAMLVYLAKIAAERQCGRFEWWVLDWNTPAIEFYKSLGAEAMHEWTVYREAGDALTKLAEQVF